jgi:hypothetical protein
MASAGSGTIGTTNNRYLYRYNNYTRDVTQGDLESKGNLGMNGYSFFGTDSAASAIGQNGRVNGLTGAQSYKTSDTGQHSFTSEAIKGIHTESGLSDIFFSSRNIEQVHAGIRYGVHKRTKKVIDNQDEDELKVIMRSMYLQYSQNLSCKFEEQVSVLNHKVIDYCVPQIVTKMQQYFKYISDISTQPDYMTHPVNVSSKGEKTYALDYFL